MQLKYAILPVVFLQCLLSVTVHAQQEKNIDAHYQKAEKYFNEGNFSAACDELYDCDKILGKPNSKTVYLRVKAMNGMYPQKQDTFFVNQAVDYARYFLSNTDSTTYSKEKYAEIAGLLKEFEGRKKQLTQQFIEKDINGNYTIGMLEYNRLKTIEGTFKKGEKPDPKLKEKYTEHVNTAIQLFVAVLATIEKMDPATVKSEDKGRYKSTLILLADIYTGIGDTKTADEYKKRYKSL